MLDINMYKHELDLIDKLYKKNHQITSNDITTIFKDVNDDLFFDIVDYYLEKGINIIGNSDLFEKDDVVNESKLEEEIEKLKNDPVFLNDPVKMYLQEIGKIKLLNTEEEIKYAEALQKGLLAETKLAAEKSTLTEDEISKLKEIITEGISSRQVLIESNLKLVVSIAKNYLGRNITFLDLIQEGNLGLMKAVYRFDPTKGFRFSTYATWWIKQSISRAICDQSRMVRLPVHMVDLLNQVLKAKKTLTQTLQKEPSFQDIADYLKLPVEKIEFVMQVGQDSVSLDTNVGDDEESTLGEFLPDDKLISPFEYTNNLTYHEELNQMLHTLTPREEKIIRMRYGLIDNHIYTLEEVGSFFNITRERVRQIEIKAICRLRHPSRIKMLKNK